MRKVKISEVYQELYRTHYSKPRFQTSRYAKEVEMNWRNHIEPTFGDKLVARVTPPVIFNWHRRFTENPYAGNRSKALLSKIFAFAELKGYLPAGANPCRAVPHHPEEKRKRYASDKELEVVGKLLTKKEAEFPREVAFLKLLMLTGSRPSAIERAKFSDLLRLDDAGFLRLRGKSGVEEIALSLEAMRLIETLRTLAKDEKSTLTGIKFPRHFWGRIRKEAKCPDLWARDFRRTFATTALSSGHTLGAVGELLNHKTHQTTMVYAKLTPNAKVEASLQIGLLIQQKMKGVKPAR